MKTIIIQYKEEEELGKIIKRVKQIESSSGASLCKRALFNYCQKILGENNGIRNQN